MNFHSISTNADFCGAANYPYQYYALHIQMTIDITVPWARA